MSPDFLRGQQLFSLGRYDAAAESLRASIAAEPEWPDAYMLLSLCLSRQQQPAEALRVAEDAIACDPEDDRSHYAKAVALASDQRWRDADQALAEAIAIDPDDADYYALRASVLQARDDLTGALAATDAGLAIDPEHDGCTDLRGHILTRLGRTQEARETIEGALQRSPEDPRAHANQGWVALRGGRVDEALTHLEEALRLDPGNQFARAGLVEALKARNPIYRLLFVSMQWLASLNDLVRWAIIIGGYVAHQLIADVVFAYPTTGWFLNPLWWAYLVFVFLTWLGEPIFDLLLWFNPRGRHALHARQRRGAAVTAVFILVAVAGLLWYVLADRALGLLGALAAAMIAMHAHRACLASNPRHGRLLGLGVVGLVGLATAALWLIAADDVFGARLWTYLFYGWIAMMFFDQYLERRGY